MIYKLQNGWTIPLGGDYLEYLQNVPEVSGGSIQSSVKTEKLPEKFHGSQQAARTYAEGYQKGAKPVTKAINIAGQNIFNGVKTTAMFVPGPTGAITWLGQMGADTANGEYSKVVKDLGAAVLIGAGLKGAQAGAKAVGRTLAGKGINIPWLDAYDYSALRNQYFNRAAKRARIITPNKGYDNFSNLDVYKDVFYNHPAIEITEPVTDVTNIPGIKVGNPKDIAKLRVSPSSAMETGYIDFFDESKPFRRDLRKAYDIVRDGTSYHFGHPLEEGVIYRTRDGYEFLEYPRGSNTRYYTGKIKTEGYTPTLVHSGEPNMKGTIQLPRSDPFKRNSEDYLWWQRNSPWVRYTKGKTVRINDAIPTKAAWGSDYTDPIRLSGAFDLSDSSLNATMMEYNPLTKTWARVKYHVPQSTISPQEAVTTYHGFQNTFDDISQIPEPLGIGYSGHTPTKNVFNQRFVDDVIEAVKMANARGPIEEPKTTLFDIDKLKEIGRGAEHIVYEHPTDPNKVLKIPYGGERRGIQNVLDYGKWYISANDPLYNMRLNIEGLTKENQYGFQSPVFSQYKLQTLPDYAKSLEEAKALRLAIDKFALRIGADPIYNWKLKLPVNNVILENTEFIRTGGKDFKPDNIGFTKDGFLMGYDLHKQGGIIKGQNGFLNTWQKAYNSKFGKGLRDFMFGKDRDLTDEEYFEKYGYNKPIGGIGVLGVLVAPEWEGLEIPEITAQHIGNQGKILRWFESGNSKMTKVPIKETSKNASNWQKFLKLSQQEQDDFVRRWNGESFQGFATLKGDKQALGRFRSWINSRK